MTQEMNSAGPVDRSLQSEPKPKKKKTITVVIFFIVIAVILYVGVTAGIEWWEEKQMWVKMGFASEKFPFRMFTERELVEKGLWSGESPELNAVLTTVRPEETYAKFRQALIDGDLDIAVECFTETRKQEWKTGLEDVLQDNLLRQEMLNELPEELEDTEIYIGTELIHGIEKMKLENESRATYHYSILSDGKWRDQAITFEKNWDGVWLIENL